MRRKPLTIAQREHVAAVRRACYDRAEGRCELQLSPNCIKGILPWDGPDVWSHGHMAHLRGKRRNGTSAEICKWSCWHCHLVMLHAGGKPCPPKPRTENASA